MDNGHYRPLTTGRARSTRFSRESCADALIRWRDDINLQTGDRIEKAKAAGRHTQLQLIIDGLQGRGLPTSYGSPLPPTRQGARFSKREFLIVLTDTVERIEKQHDITGDDFGESDAIAKDPALAETFGRWQVLAHLIFDLESHLLYNYQDLPLGNNRRRQERSQ